MPNELVQLESADSFNLELSGQLAAIGIGKVTATAPLWSAGTILHEAMKPGIELAVRLRHTLQYSESYVGRSHRYGHDSALKMVACSA